MDLDLVKILAGGGSLGIVGRLLISQYFKQAEKLQALKEKNTRSAIRELQESVAEIKQDNFQTREKIHELEKSLIKHGVKIEGLQEVVDQAVRLVERTSKRDEVHTEVRNLGPSSRLVTTKKGEKP